VGIRLPSLVPVKASFFNLSMTCSCDRGGNTSCQPGVPGSSGSPFCPVLRTWIMSGGGLRERAWVRSCSMFVRILAEERTPAGGSRSNAACAPTNRNVGREAEPEAMEEFGVELIVWIGCRREKFVEVGSWMLREVRIDTKHTRLL
jgi:hypothetical protein